MRRYRLRETFSTERNGWLTVMEEHPNGPYVQYHDHEIVAKQNRAARELLQWATRYLFDCRMAFCNGRCLNCQARQRAETILNPEGEKTKQQEAQRDGPKS